MPEIETTVANTGGILSDVVLRDGDGLADRYVFGTAPAGVNGVNVNTDDPVPDADITLVAPFFQDFVAEGGARGRHVHERGRGGDRRARTRAASR